MGVVQQRQFGAELVAYRLEHAGHVAEVGPGVPGLLDGQGSPAGRLVVVPGHRGGGRPSLAGLRAAGIRRRRHPVHGRESRDTGLHPDRSVSTFEVLPDGVEQLGKVGAGGVSVGEASLPASTAEELVQRQVGGLRLDVPQGGVDRGDGGHGHRSAAPVRPAVEVLPGVLDPVGVPSDQQRHQMVAQVGRHGELAPVQRGIAQSDEAVVGGQPERDEVPSGAGDEDLGRRDVHGALSYQIGGGDRTRGRRAASRDLGPTPSRSLSPDGVGNPRTNGPNPCRGVFRGCGDPVSGPR
jgi:hypothetical protein